MPESSIPIKAFAGRLRNARAARHLSQSDLAKRAKLQASAVSHFETGTRKPSFDNLKRLADALRVTTDYLLGRTDLMEASTATADQLHRHYSGLSAEYQEVAEDFIEMLAEKAEKQRHGAE
ncbi:MAG: helix-turn-helix transcriptional regulator [Gammaproteobacteria bacterium]|nr:helix-turn-helix transcriptional regulator [Gammaproteobacteria bacterium]